LPVLENAGLVRRAQRGQNGTSTGWKRPRWPARWCSS